MKLIVLLLSVIALSACGDTQATGTVYATQIPGPEGVQCFAIYNSAGEVISGNCVKD